MSKSLTYGGSGRPVRLAIIGTGGIGRLHAERAAAHAAVDLVGLCGLDDGADALAGALGAPLVRDYERLLQLEPEAVIVATPNQTHLEIGGFFADNGIHILIEKPIAETLDAAGKLCARAEEAGVYILVGHHRRHHSLVRAAREFVQDHIGTLVTTNTLVTMRKPDSYYELEWRRSEAAGPLLVNLIHEVDLLRTVCGEIDRVQAASAKLNRTFEFDDTAAMILHFANGGLGTIVISESTASPWSWEASVSDGMGFHNAGQDHAQFIGTNASLSFPSLTAWRYDEGEAEPGWESPLHSRRIDVGRNNPYDDQIAHFAQVVRGEASPLVSGRDGLRSLAVVDAVVMAAAIGEVVEVDKLLTGL